MQDLGVNISHEEQISSSNEFQDMSFVITGKFSKFSRNELKGIIESKGGKVSGSISSKTNYLVLGEDPGSKLEKAQKLKIDILGKMHEVSIIEDSPYDSENKLLRA